jgi:arylsulfatase A-like enzyme
MKKTVFTLFLILGVFFGIAGAAENSRPNILWIIIDDMSANFSCYGETLIQTPHVDKLAEEGVKFTKAFVTAPVCSTNRSAFITGMYQTAIGAHQHRSGRGKLKIHLPAGIRPIPELFQDAGYYTAITGWPNKSRDTNGKTDYNFEWDKKMYDGTDWSKRKKGQPFFAQIQLPGGKHRGGDLAGSRKFIKQFEAVMGPKTDPQEVVLPPYYPRDPVLLEDWAAYLDTVRYTDYFVGEIMQRLKDEGDYENTVVLFMTDHGISHARGKQFLYDEGLHVPLVIAGPGIKAGQVRNDLVEHIDIAALSLGIAGIDIPEYMQAKDILSPDYKKRNAIFAARDRCDETVEHMRCLRTQRYKYIRNFLPERPHLQPNRYKDKKDILIALRKDHEAGTLNAAQELIFAPTRPKEELYDLKNDPYEINNLADDPNHQEQLLKFRARLDKWIVDSHDQGPESEAMYDSDMAVYLNDKDSEAGEVLRENIAQMKKWATEGK